MLLQGRKDGGTGQVDICHACKQVARRNLGETALNVIGKRMRDKNADYQ